MLHQTLIKTALAHLEFEALHPFMDGNGRVGRILIPLLLWKHKVLTAPHFYVSGYFEAHRDEYIDRMREVSRSGAWTDWIIFFLEALEFQARENLATAERIRSLYQDMKNAFPELLKSHWSMKTLDFLFSKPIFRSNSFIQETEITEGTAYRFIRLLVEKKMLHVMQPGSRSGSGLYGFRPYLIEEYQASNREDAELRFNIAKTVDSSVELRNKKDLIERFIDTLNLGSSVGTDWPAFIKRRKIAELDEIITEENLDPDSTYRFMKNAFRDQGVQVNGIAITKILPPVSRFGADRAGAVKKTTVVAKLTDFFDRFFDISGDAL